VVNIERAEKMRQIKIEQIKKNLNKSRMPDLIKRAAINALPTDLLEISKKQFWLSSFAVRRDGAIVSSRNGSPYCTSTEHYQKQAKSHSEVRCLFKAGKGSTLYVARISRENFGLAMSRPCCSCRIFLKSYKVEKVYYTINNECFGIFYPKKDYDQIVMV
jgi:cytidine deaminase